MTYYHSDEPGPVGKGCGCLAFFFWLAAFAACVADRSFVIGEWNAESQQPKLVSSSNKIAPPDFEISDNDRIVMSKSLLQLRERAKSEGIEILLNFKKAFVDPLHLRNRVTVSDLINKASTAPETRKIVAFAQIKTGESNSWNWYQVVIDAEDEPPDDSWHGKLGSAPLHFKPVTFTKFRAADHEPIVSFSYIEVVETSNKPDVRLCVNESNKVKDVPRIKGSFQICFRAHTLVQENEVLFIHLTTYDAPLGSTKWVGVLLDPRNNDKIQAVRFDAPWFEGTYQVDFFTSLVELEKLTPATSYKFRYSISSPTQTASPSPTIAITPTP